MPGIENFAPERTETSSGFFDVAELAPAARSSFLKRSSIWRSTSAGVFRPSL